MSRYAQPALNIHYFPSFFDLRQHGATRIDGVSGCGSRDREGRLGLPRAQADDEAALQAGALQRRESCADRAQGNFKAMLDKYKLLLTYIKV